MHKHIQPAVRVLLAAFVACMLLTPALAAFGGAQPAAQGNGLSVYVSAGYDRYLRDRLVTPVRVTLDNQGPDLDAQIELLRPANFSDFSGNTLYTRPVSLPTRSHKVETLYVPGSGDLVGGTVVVRAGGKVLAQAKLDGVLIDNTDLLVAVASSQNGLLDFLGTVKAPATTTRVAQITLEQLPALSGAWDMLDVLVVDDRATNTLSDAQREALAAWIERGGHLVVAGGPGWQATASGLDALLPAAPGGTVNLPSLDVLATVNNAPLAPGPYVAAQLAPRPGARVVLAQGNVPIVVQAARELGRVTYLALSTNVAPLNNWSGNPDLWKSVILKGMLARGEAAGIQDYGSAAQAVAALPDLTLPSTLEIIGFLGLYVIVIGPVNYLVLRRARRPELAWLTIPALVILFTASAYFTGLQFRGTRPTLHRLAVVSTRAGAGNSQADLLIGIFSPQRRGYDLRLPGRVALRPLRTSPDVGGGESFTILQGDGETVAQDVNVDIAGMRQFTARTSAAGAGIEADLTAPERPSSLRYTGTLRNAGQIDFKSAVLLYGANAVAVGDLPPGKQIDVAGYMLALGSAPYGTMVYDTIAGSPSYGGGREAWRKRELAYAALSTSGGSPYGAPPALGRGLYLLAWADTFPAEAELAGSNSIHNDLSLYVVELPARTAEGAGEIVELLNDDRMQWSVVEQSGTVYSDSSMQSVSMEAGASLTVEFRAPEPIDVSKVTSINYVIDTYSPEMPGPIVSLYNWRTAAWDAVPWQGYGARVDAPGNARDYISPQYAVRMRLDANAGAFYASGFDLSIEGTP